MDGAFFPQPQFEVPEEEMGQHACKDMVVPAFIFAHLAMIHAQFGFGFFETLLNGPSQPAEPYKQGEPAAHGSVAEIVTVNGVLTKGSADNQPQGLGGQSVAGKYDPAFGELIDNRAFRAL